MEDYKQKTINGFKWNLLDKIISQGANFAITIILARILLPADFGLLGMVVVITGFAAIFKDFGLGSAIVQRKNLSDDDLSSIFWFNLLMGTFLFALIYISSNFIANYYSEPQLKEITQLLSTIYFIGALNIVQLSLLLRHLDFRKIFFVNALSTVISGLVAIVLAFLDWGVWSLVWKMILFTLITNFALWFRSDWRPKLKFSTTSLREIMKFSVPLLGTQSLNYWVRNIDNLLIGKYIGNTALGYYNQSYRIMLIPVRQFSGVISAVLFPSFALIQDDTLRIKNIYFKIIRLLSFATFPLMFGLCALSDPFVKIVLGEQWTPMIQTLSYLSIVGAFQSVGTLNGNIFQALGRTSYQFWIGLPVKALHITAIVLGLKGGIEGVAFYYMIAVLMSSVYMYYFTGRLIDASLKEIYAQMFANIIFSLSMAILVGFMYSFLLYKVNLSLLSSFLFSVVTGIIIYIFLNYFVYKKNGLLFLTTIKEVQKRN